MPNQSTSQSAVPDAQALRLVMDMMAIPGASGDEAAVMQFVRAQLLAAGVEERALVVDDANRRSPLGGVVGNLILKLPGTRRAPRRMLSAHLDTVPICVGSRPVRQGSVVRSADRTTGLGADNRAGSAVLLTTALAILRADLPHPPLTFLWTVQEESGLCGARHVRLARLGKPRLAFNFDGGDPRKLTIGATGGYRMTIDIRGHASHAGNHPEKGASAIAIAALAIADLVENGWHGLISKNGKTGTSNIGVIRGGAATNVVADHVQIRAEARSHDPGFRPRIVKAIETAFRKATRKVRSAAGDTGRVDFDGRLDYESFRLDADSAPVVVARQAVEAEAGSSELAITNGGLDANWLTAHGIPTVSLGCGQRNIHTVREELDIADFHLARRIALRLATDALEQPPSSKFP